MSTPILDIQECRKIYRGPSGEVRVLDAVSLQIGAGECVAVVGPSGCGKTTLLLAAGGLQAPDAGKIVVTEQDLYALSNEERARFRAANIGFVFQQFHLLTYLSVLDNVLAPSLALRQSQQEARARELLTHFGLTDRMAHVPAALSTGERQRTALARALLNKPRLLLADEPTGNLDAENGRVVLGYLAEFTKRGGSVLLVTHDARVSEFAHRVLRLKDGRLQL